MIMGSVIHLIPYDGVGGVETAARSMDKYKSSNFKFSVRTIFNAEPSKQPFLKYNPLPYLGAIISLWRHEPDVLIVSLWRCCFVGIMLKLIMPNLRLVLFLHSPVDAHLVDRILTKLAVKLSTEIWSDSVRTLEGRLGGTSNLSVRIISFVTERVTPLRCKEVTPNFIFWGRIAPEKGLGKAIQIFSVINKLKPDSRFIIVGPDAGCKRYLLDQIDSLGLKESVQVLGAMSFNDIKKHAAICSFYLQTSKFEGMAMSVVEAMQLGLVPIVTPVGEIVNYAKHDFNSIIVNNEKDAVSDVLHLLEDEDKYKLLRNRAILTWTKSSLYRDSIIEACVGVMAKKGS